MTLEVRALSLILAIFLVLLGGLVLVQGGLHGTHAIDDALLKAMRSSADPSDPIGPEWFENFARDLTGLGGFGLLAIIVLGVTGFLAVTGRATLAKYIFAIGASGWLLGRVLKATIGRERPDLVPHGVEVYSSSFPSGHALTSAVVYFTLAAVLASAYPERGPKLFILILAFVLVVAIGASRVYFGVHWPSDVLGGWLVGTLWALIGVAAMTRGDPVISAKR